MNQRSTHALARRLSALALILSSMAAWGSSARAEDPDLRQFEPFVMLIVDTSGSMERLPHCECTTPGCEECLPKCDLATVRVPSNITDVNSDQYIAKRKNRWGFTLEALTGQFEDFQCNTLQRDSSFATYDLGYYLPYNQPWKCNDGRALCPMPTLLPSNVPTQKVNGVLDRYQSRLRFGLMTFDGIETYKGGEPLIPYTAFDEPSSESDIGMWSYAGKKPFHYLGCSEDYAMDTGARSSLAADGGLITLTSNACPNPPCSMYQINETIQSTLLGTRPYLGTPIAASLDDLYYHFKTDVNDTLAACRNRYAMLITDGYPDEDYRQFGCDCKKEQNCPSCGDPTARPCNSGETATCACDLGEVASCACDMGETPPCACDAGETAVCPCGPMETPQCWTPAECTPLNDPELMHCPYPTPEEAAFRLVNPVGTDPRQMKQLFVIGISIESEAVRQKLNAIASNGGSTLDDGMGNVARFADNFDSLTATLDQLFSGLTEPVSRAVPAFVTSPITKRTYRLTAGFQKATGTLANGVAPPWTGIIERQRFICDNSTTPVGADLVDGLDLTDNLTHRDLFHMTLARRNEAETSATMRKLYTTMPSGTVTTNTLLGTLGRGYDSAKCGSMPTDYCNLVELDPMTPKMDPALLGITTGDAMAQATERQQAMDWMYGRAGSVRFNQSLGDIYHSSPTLARQGTHADDDAYGDFLIRPEVACKPLVMYIGSNDGILHAFAVEDYQGNNAACPNAPSNALQTFAEGEEMWGFVPPVLIPTMKDQLFGHQFGVDATPVIKDVRFNTSGALKNQYHTVLVSGLRGGGKSFFALDITDPIHPQFLWQFSDPHAETGMGGQYTMGDTFGKPVIAQLNVQYDAGSKHIDGLRAVAILPGGRGTKWNGVLPAPPGCSTTGTPKTPSAKDGTADYFSYQAVDDTMHQLKHRSYVPCWNRQGRALYFVDVETGYLIKTLWSDDNGTSLIFPSPLTGSPTVFPDAVGVVANEGFVLDADGVLWRLDLTGKDPDNWSIKPFHDLFWGEPLDKGETSYEIPLLTLDEQKRLVVIVASGDTDNFDKPTVNNRIVSLTEVDGGMAAVNWQLDGDKPTDRSLEGMVTSELVTGSMALFEGRLFFATFAPKVTSDPCQLGKGRLWSVDYRTPSAIMNADGQTFAPKLIGLSAAEIDPTRNSTTSGVGLFNIPIAAAPDNTMVFGLGATQLRCPRTNDADDITNYFNEKLPEIQQTSAPSIWIVAQTSGNSDLVQSGSVLGSINVQLDRATSFARMTSWAASTD